MDTPIDSDHRLLILRHRLCLALLCQSGWAHSTETAPSDSGPQRLLFVGNRYFYDNYSLHNHVRRLVTADRAVLEKSLAYKSATIGGATLAHHNIDW